MHAIWKFPLELGSVQGIDMPIGARLLTVQAQNGTPVLWAVVDTTRERTQAPRKIICFGTGWAFQSLLDPYLGTVQIDDCVWHYFDGGELEIGSAEFEVLRKRQREELRGGEA